jgi:hypothetical protein
MVEFSLWAAHELWLLHHFQVQSAGELARLVIVAGCLVTAAHEVTTSGFISFCSAAKLKLTGIGLLGELSGTLLSLVEVVVCSLDAAILISVFSSLHSVKVSAAFDFVLVASTLLLEFSEFVTGVVDFLAECMAAVAFLRNVALSGEDLGLTAADLLAGRGDLGWKVVVGPVLLVEQETGVVDLFLQALNVHCVGVGASLEVVILKEFFILEVTVLGLDCV